MLTPEIIAYIKSEREKKTPDSTIRSSLLANGWTDRDIDEGFSPKAKPTVEGKKTSGHKQKRVWITFAILAAMDFTLIMYMNGQGVFGVSPISIIIRLVVIYGIASFAAIGSKEKPTTAQFVIDSIARTIAAIFIVFLIAIGIFFAYCFFAFNGTRL